jgi:hypothetical protein
MAVELTTIHDCAVLRDDTNTWRWYDAFGPNVVKYEMNMAAIPTDNTTGMPTEWTNTLVGASTFVRSEAVAGGAVALTTAGANNDGIKLQLGSETGGLSENVSFAWQYPTYFSIKMAISDADQSDVLAGFCVTDTTCLDGVDDGIFFRSIDETATLNFVLVQNGDESVVGVATLVDATVIHCEFFYWAGNVYVYVDDVLMATIADDDANFCNDELMRLTLEFLTGDAAVVTCTVRELRFIQIQR